MRGKRGGSRKLRIIGGSWRGRNLLFAECPAIRPTPDRVRETLFNWLQGTIRGARCLDLFAGSGALGLEALSRGAAQVDFVEQDRSSAQSIQQHLELLQAEGGRVQRGDALRFL
ncbi:MAG: 16S rRNA (guanine(966)-N(2))-methyltransferase RsmD, partial [Gammaproteobacteria bacterium]|nr:16S rRNA (guanine(966)-N(2))-methyltransferase RsmD [Gammaproteobacteria bacterium]